MAKPRVFPEPVLDFASVSRPAVASSITMAWMGNGAKMPRASSASTTGSETPSSRKVRSVSVTCYQATAFAYSSNA